MRRTPRALGGGGLTREVAVLVILDRVVTPATSLEDAQKAALLSMDSTMKSNLSVGMPLDLAVIERDACRVSAKRRIMPADAQFSAMSDAWSEALRDAFVKMPI